MNNRQKENLIKAFEELNAPDKDVLLQKIESKKAFGGQFVEPNTPTVQNTKRKRRVVWTSVACSVVVVVIAVILLSVSVFQPNDAPGDLGTSIIDYRGDWQISLDNKICFDQIDKNMKEAGVDLIYEYDNDWSIVKTQITQDESGYREYYVKDGISVEVTVLLEARVTSVEGKYDAIFKNINGSFVYGDYRVYNSNYYVNSSRKNAYLIYLEDRVFIFESDVDLKEFMN
ncbi:MAG: hypothetical protein K2O95_07220 [Clostridia bacterium]|nr:hypothetical protein [Clostridia bacterium]